MTSTNTISWLNKELSALLECDIGEEYSKNILKIETEPEVREFIGSLLDLDEPKNVAFLDDLLTKLNMTVSKVPDVIVYRKPDLDETINSKSKNKRAQQQQQPSKEPSPSLQQQMDQNLKRADPFRSQKNKNHPTAGSVRVACHCQAAKHKLVANCLKCGRIICDFEGSGPCYFCNNLVCTKEEFEKIHSGSNKGQQLHERLMEKQWAHHQNSTINASFGSSEKSFDMSALQKAIAHKDKLIDYNNTAAKRTQVIDDESDYFNTNSKWLNQDQREKLEKKQEEIREKRFGSRIGKTFTLDFAGRKIVDEQRTVNLKDYEKEIEGIMESDKRPAVPVTQMNTVVNQDIQGLAPVFIEDESMKKRNKSNKMMKADANNNAMFRLQDQALQEMKDDGMCLSMHQPWASLLVMGIKKHEGRTWYTPYRGRLWIHAASKQPDECGIKEMESFYKVLYSNQNIKFPDAYPTSCLLGYVDLTDCLAADVYKEEFPNGESESDFVFICSNFNELVAKIPMSGQHKLFKLERNTHTIAKKTSVRYRDGES